MIIVLIVKKLTIYSLINEINYEISKKLDISTFFLRKLGNNE